VFVPQIVDIAQRCCASWLQQGRVSGFDKSKEYTFLVAPRAWRDRAPRVCAPRVLCMGRR